MKRERGPLNWPVRALLVVLGTLCVVLAVLGMFLPLLPTTPLLLLAAICYARSSETFYHWLITNRWFGDYIRNYREGRGISSKQKGITLFFLWGTILFTVLFAVSQWWIRLVLIGIAVGVSIHLLNMKTYRPETSHKQGRCSGEGTRADTGGFNDPG